MERYSDPAKAIQPDRAAIREIIRKCSLSPMRGQGATIFFIGDSQSDHIKGLAGEINKKMGVGVQAAAVTSTIYPVAFYDANNGENISVQLKRAEIQEEIVRQTLSRAKSGDLIVLSGRYSAYFGSPNLPLHQRKLNVSRRSSKVLSREVSIDAYLRDWSLRLSSFLDRINQKRMNAVIILPTPEFPYSGAKCVNPLNRLNGSTRECAASRDWLLKNRSKFAEQIHALQFSHRNLFIYDRFNSLCPESSMCSTLAEDGKSLYRDATHLSNLGAKRLYSDFKNFVLSNKILDAS